MNNPAKYTAAANYSRKGTGTISRLPSDHVVDLLQIFRESLALRRRVYREIIAGLNTKK